MFSFAWKSSHLERNQELDWRFKIGFDSHDRLFGSLRDLVLVRSLVFGSLYDRDVTEIKTVDLTRTAASDVRTRAFYDLVVQVCRNDQLKSVFFLHLLSKHIFTVESHVRFESSQSMLGPRAKARDRCHDRSALKHNASGQTFTPLDSPAQTHVCFDAVRLVRLTMQI